MVSALETVCLSADSNSIDTGILEMVIPKDEGHNTQAQIFKLKSSNPNLKMLVSVRGWTF